MNVKRTPEGWVLDDEAAELARQASALWASMISDQLNSPRAVSLSGIARQDMRDTERALHTLVGLLTDDEGALEAVAERTSRHRSEPRC